MSMTTPNAPILSLVLCSRNDAYMGNSRWRLETTLNYIGMQAAAMGAENRIEIVVADWGSVQPLKDIVALYPEAARITSFVSVPPGIAQSLQRDSPFAEVVAINAAARRARGQYIGRIDQDTLVGRRFLTTFVDWVERNESPVRAPLHGALWFSCRRSLPYRFAVQCPRFREVVRAIGWFGRRMEVEIARTFYHSSVGIWLVHRDVWDECGGYDERMIYMNDMEIDMAARLMTRYPMIDLGKLVAYDFYHLDHYHPRGPRTSGSHRRVNNQSPRASAGFRPSGPLWGMATATLEVAPATWCRKAPRRSWLTALQLPVFFMRAGWIAARTVADRLSFTTWPLFRQRWTRRARLGWQAVTGQPLSEWPGRLRRAWVERPSSRTQA
jgi:hypothetical protein